MLIKSTIIFLLLLLSVYAGVYLQHDSGYVLITFHNWTIETSILVWIFFVILFFITIHVLFIIVNKVIKIPAALHKWRIKILAHRSQAKTKQGLIEFNEGHWEQAKKHLIDALPNADTPLLNYLTAARAAQEMGDSTQRDNFLRQAQQSMPEAKIAVELTQAQLQIANQQWEQALATLKHLRLLAPNHKYVLKLLIQLYEEIKEWSQIIDLLPIIKKNRILSPAKFQSLQQNAYLQQLNLLINQAEDGLVNKLMANLPKELKYYSGIICKYTKFLINKNQQTEAEYLIRKSLPKYLQDNLLELYSELDEKHLNLRFIESLLKKNNHSNALYLCLGKICLNKQLWGKAENYLQESIKIKPTAQAYAILGNLFEKEGKIEAACEAYRKGVAFV